MTKIASFDVFDTVLTRSVSPPFAVWLLLGKEALQKSAIDCTPEYFAHARMQAHTRAYDNSGGADALVNLPSIYRELSHALNLTPDQSEQLIKMECSLETRLIRSVPGTLKRVKEVRSQGCRVAFLTDIYLSSDFIRDQLRSRGFWQEGDVLYVSGEYGKSKFTGRLFRELINQENISPAFVTHFGNDLISDIRPAEKIGMHTEFLAECNPNRYEQILEAQTWSSEGLSSAMAGASRLARLTQYASASEQKGLINVAAGVVAPALVGYVLWVLQRAQQLGIQRLYFLSRDGQVLLEIARLLINKLNISCELRYLYGSRQSWNLPGITHVNKKQLACIWDFNKYFVEHVTVRSLLERFAIKPETVKESLESVGLTEESWSRNLSPEEREALYELLLRDSDIQCSILNSANQTRERLLKYFRQEGLFESRKWALVDLGWHGSMQNSLGRILATQNQPQPICFYFGLRDKPLTNQFNDREAYFFDERQDLGFYLPIVPRERSTFQINRILKTFCITNHGTVLGFMENNGQVYPTLQVVSHSQLLEKYLIPVRKTIYIYVENLLLNSALINPRADVRSSIKELFNAFWLNPSSDEAAAWSKFPWEAGFGRDSQPVELATGYRWSQVITALREGKMPLHHPYTWVEGSIALSPLGIRLTLKTFRRLSKLHKSKKGLKETLVQGLRSGAKKLRSQILWKFRQSFN